MQRANRPPGLNFALAAGFQPAPEKANVPIMIDDTYLNWLEDMGHASYRELLLAIASADGQTSLGEQQHDVSQNAKGLEKDWKPAGWTPDMRQDYHAYKQLSTQIKPAKGKYKASKQAYHEESRASAPNRDRLLALRLTYITNLRDWFKTALSAAQLRVDFLVKYPKAFNREGASGHVHAARVDFTAALGAYNKIEEYEASERRRLGMHQYTVTQVASGSS